MAAASLSGNIVGLGIVMEALASIKLALHVSLR